MRLNFEMELTLRFDTDSDSYVLESQDERKAVKIILGKECPLIYFQDGKFCVEV